MIHIISLATPDTACIMSVLVSTVVVWSLELRSLPSASRATPLMRLLVATVGTMVLPGLAFYFLHRFEPHGGEWGDWNTPLPPLEFGVSVLVLSGFIVLEALSTLRDLFSARVPRVRRPH